MSAVRSGKFLAAHFQPDAMPDLVVMAKGLGAGYAPLGAVLAPASMVDELAGLTGFNVSHTFNANPICCAAGVAVIDEVVDRDLMGNAERMGEYLRAGLEGLKERSPLIGDVRGRGLLNGIELVADRETQGHLRPGRRPGRPPPRARHEARDPALRPAPERRPVRRLVGDRAAADRHQRTRSTRSSRASDWPSTTRRRSCSADARTMAAGVSAPAVTYLEAIRAAMRDAMREDDRVFLMGEDVGHFGGPFGVTSGLFDEFGGERVDRHADLGGGLRRRGVRRRLDGRAADRRAAVRRLRGVPVRPDRHRRREDALAQRHPAARRDPPAHRRRRPRRPVPRLVARGLVRRRGGTQGRLPGHGRRRLRPAAQRHRGRRPGAVLRAQGALPPAEGAAARHRSSHRDRPRRRGARAAAT